MYKGPAEKGPAVERPHVKWPHVIRPHVKRPHPIKAASIFWIYFNPKYETSHKI